MQYKRSTRVGDQIRKDISEIILHSLKDPRLGFITINEVELTDDLRIAKIFYTVLGDEKSKAESQKGLECARGFIQREIGKRIRLKRTPELIFKYDHSIDRAAKIEQLLKEVQEKSTPQDDK
jgi:ribosome-binding factor A